MGSIKQKYQTKSVEIMTNFQLIPLAVNKRPFFKPLIVDLSEKAKSIKKTKTAKSQLVYPQWNADSLCYTPGFIIPQDQGKFEKIQSTFRECYLQGLKHGFQESNNVPLHNIKIPCPRDQHYCGVCKTEYSSYQDHIISQQHFQNCLNSPFTHHIYDFCSKYGPSNKSENQNSTNYQISQQKINQTPILFPLIKRKHKSSFSSSTTFDPSGSIIQLNKFYDLKQQSFCQNQNQKPMVTKTGLN